MWTVIAVGVDENNIYWLSALLDRSAYRTLLMLVRQIGIYKSPSEHGPHDAYLIILITRRNKASFFYPIKSLKRDENRSTVRNK